MKRQHHVIPSKFLPLGSKRINNQDDDRVWLINGKEYLSKAAYFKYLEDVRMSEKIRAAAKQKADHKEEEKPVAVFAESLLCPECQVDLHLFSDGKYVCRNEVCSKYDQEVIVKGSLEYDT